MWKALVRQMMIYYQMVLLEPIFLPPGNIGKGAKRQGLEIYRGCYAGSWIVEKSKSINPGLLQLSGGLAVVKSIEHESLKIKWPNDILINNRKLSEFLLKVELTAKLLALY